MKQDNLQEAKWTAHYVMSRIKFSALLLNFCQKKQEIGVGHMGCGFPALGNYLQI